MMKKILILLILVPILTSFLIMTAHSHPDGEHQDCGACLFAQALAQLFFFAVVFLLAAPAASKFVRDRGFRVPDFSPLSILRERAPPFSF